MSKKRYDFLFEQVDSWFFRESRSMDGSGSTRLDSIFPPSNNTLFGAIRTKIGNQYNCINNSSWRDFKLDSQLAKIIGYGTYYADLTLQGVWLYNKKEKQIYFPLPKNILKQESIQDQCIKKKYMFFKLKSNNYCDLGKSVTLPFIQREKYKKTSTISDAYVSKDTMQSILANKLHDIKNLKQIIMKQDIFEFEPRLGIERNNLERKANDGKLYQTNHIRLKDEWALYLGVNGLKENIIYLKGEKLLPLGGETRMSKISLREDLKFLPFQKIKGERNIRLVIYLLTSLPDYRKEEDKSKVILPNNSFVKHDKENQTYWEGKINDIDIKVITGITGKIERVGGWDMAKFRSSPVRSFIPAGSCWYVDIKNKKEANIIVNNLHGKYLTKDKDKALGYGQIAIGFVKKNKGE